jgi:hypothetical protein
MVSTRVAIAGVSSEVGVTTLLCELLKKLPGWEAIKITRGPYRLCGRDPHCTSQIIAHLKNSILPTWPEAQLASLRAARFFQTRSACQQHSLDSNSRERESRELRRLV